MDEMVRHDFVQVQLEDDFLEFLHDTEVVMQVHVAIGSDCQTIAATPVKFCEILSYPTNKVLNLVALNNRENKKTYLQLHGSVVLSGVRGSSKEGSSLGSLDYWIKLHTHDTKRVLRWMERRRARETLARLGK